MNGAPAAGGEANRPAQSGAHPASRGTNRGTLIPAQQVTGPARPEGQTPPAPRGGPGWLLIRVTGLLLSVLVLGHLLAVHLLTDVARTTSSFVLRRWSSGLWIGWDGTMLTAALAHGAAGLWVVIQDHTRPGAGRTAAGIILTVVSLALVGLGCYTITAVVQSALARP